MADPDRIVSYNGYEIRIFVLRPITMEKTFRAKYEVRSMADEAQQSPRAGIIAGGFETPDQAEEAALKAAKYMID